MQHENDFSQHVREILNRHNIQIRSLDLLAPEIRQKYFQQRSKAMLLAHNRVFEHEIDELDPLTIDVFDTSLIGHLRPGQLVIVVLSSDDGEHRYVLQTGVQNIYMDRLRLSILDPRKNKRYLISSSCSVALRAVPDAILLKIQSGELRSIRSTVGLSAKELVPVGGNESQASADSNQESALVDDESAVLMGREKPKRHRLDAGIEDLLCPLEASEPAPEYGQLAEISALDGKLADISNGGMCVHCAEAKGKILKNQFVFIESSLESGDDESGSSRRLALRVFAVVRNISEKKGFYRLHLQYLVYLPETAIIFYPS